MSEPDKIQRIMSDAVARIKAAKWSVTEDPDRAVFYNDLFEQLEAFGTVWGKFLSRVIADQNRKRGVIRDITHRDLLLEALTLKEFEAETAIDYLLVPYYLLRWLFAYVCTILWGYWRIVRRRPKDGLDLAFCMMWGRHDSPEPTICPRCLWAGMRRWCWHGYESDGVGDVEPVDDCPRCGNSI